MATWKPPQTGDKLLDRSFQELSDKFQGVDALLSSVAVPLVSVTARSLTITSESFVDYRGPGGHEIQLPPASSRGTGRGSVVYVQNNGTGEVQLKSSGRDTINGFAAVTIAVGTMALASGNGTATWLALQPSAAPTTAGHVIANAGTALTQRPILNFAGNLAATDNAGAGRTDVAFTGAAGHVIDANGTALAQRGSLNFIGGAVATDNAGTGRTDVTVTLPVVPPGSGWWGSYNPTTYYPAGIVDCTDGGLAYGATNLGAAFLYAVPHYFSVSGTITELTQYMQGAGGTQKVWQAIYRSNAARTAPGARVFDAETSLVNFVHAKYANACSIAVTAGEIMWFATITLALSIAILGALNTRLWPILGTNFDGTGVGNPLRAFQVGYRVAQTYGQPPATWTGTTKLLATASPAGSLGSTPIPLFLFTPS